ncbi:hypothetical protein FRC08_014046 [Ceratobasidium sp. 394]|nr:hypothetical protein FRC08_014046 [Ceratobasidium sp. 394]
MLVSKAFQELVRREWNLYWPPFPAPPNTRILYQPIVYFETPTLPVDLSAFKYLRFASLPADQAVEYRNGEWRFRPLVVSLPPYIEELEFVWSHASEVDLIHLVKRLCPRITRLRVVHCTMFNHPECPWWYNHQLDEDHHYFKGEDLSAVTAYAESISAPLRGLPRIEQVHLGAYFIPFRAVTTHRTHPAHIPHHHVTDSRTYVDHISVHNEAHFTASWAAQHPGIPQPDLTRDRLAPRELWEKECPECAQDWSDAVERAERRAASILAARVFTLRTVSFASFLADKRTAPSEWEVSRTVVECRQVLDTQRLTMVDARLYVSTKRPGAPCSSRVWQAFRRYGAEWVIE